MVTNITKPASNSDVPSVKGKQNDRTGTFSWDQV